MEKTTVIRPVCEEDKGAWKPLWDGYNAFYGREGSTALPEAISEATWCRFFDASEPVFALEGVYERARVAGISRVYWHTQTSNTPGRTLYDKVAKHSGFIVYSHNLGE